MADERHPCIDGLTEECFRAYPEWAKQAFAYKLLNVLIPAEISKRLPKGLFPGIIGPGAILPPGWIPPPGVIVPPSYTVPPSWIPFTYFTLDPGLTWDEAFPPGWTAEEPLPPGVTIDAGVVFPVGWSAGDALPAGVTISPGAIFPPGWTPGDPLPPGVTINAGAIVPAGWSPTNPPPNWFVPGGTPGPAIPPGGVLPPLYLAPWEPGPPHPYIPSAAPAEPVGTFDGAVDTLEYVTGDDPGPKLIHIAGDVYAIIYIGPANHGFIETMTINASGQISDTVIDEWDMGIVFATVPFITHVAGDVYAFNYMTTSPNALISTIKIADNGTITKSLIDTLQFATVFWDYTNIIHVSGDIFAIPYRGSDYAGYIVTVEIAANGQITDTVIDRMLYSPTTGYEARIIHISGDIFALTHIGAGFDGFVTTVEIAANGQITDTVIDTLEFDPIRCRYSRITHVTGNIYAIVYRGDDYIGRVLTVEIATNGQITDTVKDTLIYDATYSHYQDIIHIGGGVCVIAYRRLANNGYLVSVEIAANGQITDAVIDTLLFETDYETDVFLAHVTGDIYAVVYITSALSGRIKTVKIKT